MVQRKRGGDGVAVEQRNDTSNNSTTQEEMKNNENSKQMGLYMGFPGSSGGKKSACNSGDPGPIPGSGRSPGEGNGHPLQYSCLENSMDRPCIWNLERWD